MKKQALPNIPGQHRSQSLAALNRVKWKIRSRSLHWLKRGLDILMVWPAMVLLLPLFALVALGIYLQDRGPILYWQKRVGTRGVEFNFPKFRSMCVNSDAIRAKIASQNQHGSSGVTFKMKRDPRITPIGRFIRRFSIDELPQLWCIVKGDMTLVGPRPPLPSEVAKYTLRDRERLMVTPGLTCFWQVNGRSEIPFDQQVNMDIDYIHQRSLWTDIKLLAKTIPAVIFGKGAY
jgi:lipopolysaccharide/colanic/teichoic acid biosynthesis glycosyltransferase